MPTKSQISQPVGLFNLAHVLGPGDWIQVNASELQRWTGCAEIMDGVNLVRAQNVDASIIVTNGEDGLYCFWERRQDWYYWPSLAVDVKSLGDAGAGDAVAGTALAYFETVGSVDQISPRRMLRYCAAAAGMQLHGARRHGGWQELLRFARSRGRSTFKPAARAKSRPVAAQSKSLTRWVAAAVLMVGITLGVSLLA
jgi:sugar/nucleoside kinase (ribokinase family)